MCFWSELLRSLIFATGAELLNIPANKSTFRTGSIKLYLPLNLDAVLRARPEDFLECYSESSVVVAPWNLMRWARPSSHRFSPDTLVPQWTVHKRCDLLLVKCADSDILNFYFNGWSYLMEDNDRLNPEGEVNSEEDFASLLAQYEGASSRLRPGKVVQGKIVSVFDTEVLVDAGGRAEGILKKEEITAPDGSLLYNVGDSITVLLESGTGSDQQLRVSYQKSQSCPATGRS